MPLAIHHFLCAGLVSSCSNAKILHRIKFFWYAWKLKQWLQNNQTVNSGAFWTHSDSAIITVCQENKMPTTSKNFEPEWTQMERIRILDSHRYSHTPSAHENISCPQKYFFPIFSAIFRFWSPSKKTFLVRVTWNIQKGFLWMHLILRSSREPYNVAHPHSPNHWVLLFGKGKFRRMVPSPSLTQTPLLWH